MGIRAFIAAMVGAAIGMCQFFYVAFLDVANGGFLPKGDAAYFFFSLTWLAEMFALIVIGMYRFSPWVARALRDSWEVSRILKDKSRHVGLVEWISMAAILGRAVVRIVDSEQITAAVMIGGAFALVPLIVPRPRTKQEPNQPPEPTRSAPGSS